MVQEVSRTYERETDDYEDKNEAWQDVQDYIRSEVDRDIDALVTVQEQDDHYQFTVRFQ